MNKNERGNEAIEDLMAGFEQLSSDQDIPCYVYMFNSPQFGFGKLGHSGIILQNEEGRCFVYSFHPIKNEGESFDEGSIAQLVNPQDGATFSTLMQACLTPHVEDTRKDNRGVWLQNGYTTWVERMRRALCYGITRQSFNAIEAFAKATAAHPPRFNIFNYSCQVFVNKALAAGDVVIWGKKGSIENDPVPNRVYARATGNSPHILSFKKIDFEESVAPMHKDG